MKNKIEDAIVTVKKYNVALSASKKNRDGLSWDHRRLSASEYDFRIKLSEEDKKNILENKRDRNQLVDELKRQNLHMNVINNLNQIFQFEQKNKEIKPTQSAAETLNKCAELTGLLLKAYGISASQIRKYLDGLRKIKATQTKEEFSQSDVLLQQVKVAYAAGRNRDLSFFFDIMKPAIEIGSKDFTHFEQLLRFVEAIVAYHRFYRGEN